MRSLVISFLLFSSCCFADMMDMAAGGAIGYLLNSKECPAHSCPVCQCGPDKDWDSFISIRVCPNGLADIRGTYSCKFTVPALIHSMGNVTVVKKEVLEDILKVYFKYNKSVELK